MMQPFADAFAWLVCRFLDDEEQAVFNDPLRAMDGFGTEPGQLDSKMDSPRASTETEWQQADPLPFPKIMREAR